MTSPGSGEGRTPGIVSHLPVHDGDGYSWGGDVIVTFGDRSFNLGTSKNYAKFQEIEALAHLLASSPTLLAAANEAFEFLGGVDGATQIRGKLLDVIMQATGKATP